MPKPLKPSQKHKPPLELPDHILQLSRLGSQSPEISLGIELGLEDENVEVRVRLRGECAMREELESDEVGWGTNGA